MAAERTFKLRFVGDQKSAEDAFKGAGAAAEGFSGKIAGIGRLLGDVAKIASGFVIGAGLLKLPGLLGGAMNAASDFGESLSKVRVVFGESSPEIEAWAKTAATSMGMSEGAALSAAGTFGNFLLAMGQTPAAAKDMSQTMVGLAGDMASFNNASPEEVLLALRAGLSGEAEPLKKFGVALSEAAVSAKAVELGISADGKAMTEQQKISARYAIIMAQTTTAQGDFARTSGGAANQQRILAARMSDLSVAIGEKLLPIKVKLLGLVLDLIPRFVEMGTKLGQHVAPAVEKLADGARVAAEYVRDQLVPAFMSFFANDIQPKLEAVRDVFEAIAPKVQELAASLAEKLLPPLQTVGAFIAEHKEIWAAAAIVIGGVLVGAFAAWAVAAGAAAVATIIAIAPVLAIGLALTALVAGIIWLVKNWDDLEKKYPPLKTATENVKAAFEAFVDWIKDPFIPTVQAIATTIADVVTKAVGFVRDHWGEIMAVIQPALDALAAYVKLIWDVIQVYIETTINVIKGIVDVVMGLLTGDWERAWDGVKQIVFAVWEGIKGVVSAGITFIKELAPLMLAAGQAIGGALKDGIVGALKGALELAGGIANALVELFENAINWVIDKVNDAIPNKISVPHLPDINLPDNPVGHVTIPRFAQGTPFFGGGLALVGEQGPELVGLPRGSQVIPARQTAAMLGGGGVTLNATFNIQGNADEGVLRTALERWWREKLAHEFGPGALQWGVR